MDDRDLAGEYTCISPAALASWLESRGPLLTNLPLSFSRIARLAWSGRSVFFETDVNYSRTMHMLAPVGSVAFYRQDGRRLVQFEPEVFDFEHFMTTFHPDFLASSSVAKD